MAKRRIHLSVDESAVERARRYVERRGTSLSALVNHILNGLPADGDEEPAFLHQLGPITRRLYGIAPGAGDVDDYHRHLVEKYSR